MPDPTPGVMSRLKTATADLHRMAETRPLQKSLARGTIAREPYAAFLQQMQIVHGALEAAIRRASGAHRAFAGVVKPHHERQTLLARDLEFLGAGPAEPTPAARALLDEIERVEARAPVALLGMLYVLEGSTNGSTFIARALCRSLQMKPGPGLLYLDPHGDLQRERWPAFKRDMDAVGFTEPECREIIAAAELVFQAVADISDDLMRPVAV